MCPNTNDSIPSLDLRVCHCLFFADETMQATPEEYQQFTRLDEQLTANEIVAFRVKAIAELEEQEDQEASLLSSPSSANLAVTAAGEPAVPRQTWGQWLLRRDPVPAAAASAAAAVGGDGAATAEEIGPAAGAATQREDAAAQAEFLRAFSSPGGDAEGDNDGGDEHKNRWEMREATSTDEVEPVLHGRTKFFVVESQLTKKFWIRWITYVRVSHDSTNAQT